MRILLNSLISISMFYISASVVFANEIGLDNYKLVCDGAKLKGIKEASGIAYNTETKSFFIITDPSDSSIFEISRDELLMCEGRMNKKKAYKVPKKISKKFEYKHPGLIEAEGIVYTGIGKDGIHKFAYVSEDTRKIWNLTIEGSKHGKITGIVKALGPVDADDDEDGLEGLAYNAKKDIFYAAHENHRWVKQCLANTTDGEKCWEKSGKAEFREYQIKEKKYTLGDISDLFFDEKTDHLLVLSHESERLFEYPVSGFPDGKFLASSLKIDAPQAEGVVMDDTGCIYVVSERKSKVFKTPRSSLLYVYSKGGKTCKMPKGTVD